MGGRGEGLGVRASSNRNLKFCEQKSKRINENLGIEGELWIWKNRYLGGVWRLKKKRPISGCILTDLGENSN